MIELGYCPMLHCRARLNGEFFEIENKARFWIRTGHIKSIADDILYWAITTLSTQKVKELEEVIEQQKIYIDNLRAGLKQKEFSIPSEIAKFEKAFGRNKWDWHGTLAGAFSEVIGVLRKAGMIE